MLSSKSPFSVANVPILLYLHTGHLLFLTPTSVSEADPKICLVSGSQADCLEGMKKADLSNSIVVSPPTSSMKATTPLQASPKVWFVGI